MRTPYHCLACLLPILLGAGPEPTKAEKAELAKVAAEWAGLGQWAAAHGLGAEASRCAELARAADPDHPGLDALKRLTAPSEATEADKAAWKRQHEAAAEKTAGHYEKLFLACPKDADPGVQARFDGYLLKALETAPGDRRWASAAAAAGKLLAAKQGERAARIAGAALALGAPEKHAARLLAVLDAAAAGGPLLMTASKHPLRYWLSLPRGFKRAKGKRHPVLLAVDGAGSNFKGIAKSYADARGGLPFLVAAPCTFSNTNQIEGKLREKYAEIYPEPALSEGAAGRLAWDTAGVLCMLADLRAWFDTQERVCATGFSGGGGVVYHLIFEHPELLAAAAPACANFADRGYGALKGKAAAPDLALPVFILTGGQDPHREHTHGNPAIPGIEPQTDAAMRMFEHLGYTRVERTLLPALGHSPAVREVLERLAPFWKGK